jgi:hypothetical protein
MKVEASTVSETTRRDASASGSCVQRKFVPAPIWTEAMLAALRTGVKGGKWHSLIDKVSRLETLRLGWTQVERNAGAAGVDRMSVERFAQGRNRYLAELAGALRDGSYRPQPVRRVYIPKGKGRRPLGIPAVKDRVVQAALKLVIEPIFEHEFEPRSFGFRQGLGCKDALREVDRHLKAGYFWVVDADLQSYFDTIPHPSLLAKVGKRIADGRVLELVQRFLKQDIMEDMKRWTPISGSPQGAVVSPLFANIYLHELDKDDAYAITNDGRTPSSPLLGCSRCTRPINRRANPDVETTDWRARRGRTAHRVRREGTVIAVPYPYSRPKLSGRQQAPKAAVGASLERRVGRHSRLWPAYAPAHDSRKPPLEERARRHRRTSARGSERVQCPSCH